MHLHHLYVRGIIRRHHHAVIGFHSLMSGRGGRRALRTGAPGVADQNAQNTRANQGGLEAQLTRHCGLLSHSFRKVSAEGAMKA